ncbi:phenylalanine--tRNA ligase subunit alpha [Archaeoglobus veneficus]|uniref:Phenylalanine--tRNA ligase alpha subunit n=1 Tax=Archaeoglobus veneficus (strain DSM 11195 / SNP6) TaxID=693661 RepID=F2KS20_ARCVS|nr:phenylalanine--tRNA ligase subunit alpha [Archaeoglobus veneficus]AEA46861.1 Phenylalanyl-tRNA synthetase alpha chain [Archaeoglobus veneficus SNP6]
MVLSPIEIQLLKALEEGRRYRLDEAAEASGMKKDAVLKAAHLLQEKGLAKVETIKKRIYRLTGEGERYLKEGLPEERLVKLLHEPKHIKDLEKELGKQEFGIALGWLRRKKAVEIQDGVVRLVRVPEFREKGALRAISACNADAVSEDDVKSLLRRKLIDFDEEKEIYVTVLEKPEAELKDYVTDLTPEILTSGSWKGKEFLKYDITIPSRDIFTAKLHPYERIIRECRKIFLEMGFTEIKGHYVQPAFWNFDALFQPQDHPARDMQDTFYLDSYVELEGDVVERVRLTHENGWETGSTGWGGVWSIDRARQLVLRTHTTAITIHYLAENPEPPVKAFCIDRVYRRETIDATHLPEFDQLEGVVLDENVGFKDLLGLLKEFFLKMGFEDVRFRPGYFPYTEPSVEPEVYAEGLGWIELGGAGVFRKEVTQPLGIKGRVLAWGLGIGRLAMLRLGMKDLRRLYLPDIGWLRSVPAIKR